MTFDTAEVTHNYTHFSQSNTSQPLHRKRTAHTAGEGYLQNCKTQSKVPCKAVEILHFALFSFALTDAAQLTEERDAHIVFPPTQSREKV